MRPQPLTKKDIPAAAKILRTYWKSRGMTYSEKWTQDYLTKGHATEMKKDLFFVAKEKGKVIGTMSVIIYEGDVAELRDFVVDPKLRGKGFGKQIASETLEILRKQKVRKIYALVYPEYEDFWKKYGFEREGLLKDHFAKGEDLAIVSKFLYSRKQ